jgi:hypothetical protein
VDQNQAQLSNGAAALQHGNVAAFMILTGLQLIARTGVPENPDTISS